MYTPQKASGTFSGTGSDVYVEIGFKPLEVRVYNLTDGVLTQTMDEFAPKAITVAGSGNTVDSDKFEFTERGFTFKGSTNGKDYAYVAIG